VGEQGYGVLIQTEAEFGVLFTALASHYINILFHVVYINLYLVNDYFSYLNHVQMI
jgi:hypothetical protein